jgi:hypothetical protein
MVLFMVLTVITIYYNHLKNFLGFADEAESGTGPVWTLLVSAVYWYGHAPSLF